MPREGPSGHAPVTWQNWAVTADSPPAARRPSRSLQPTETAHAAVTAALTAACAVIAVVVPFAQGASLLGMVPMGLLAFRYRLRVLLAAAVAGSAIAFLVAGVGGLMTVVNCAYIGGLAGVVKRKGRGTPTVLAASFVAGVAFGTFVVAALAVLSRLRELIFETVRANAEGTARFLEAMADGVQRLDLPNGQQSADIIRGPAEPLRNLVDDALRYWPLLIGGYSVVIIMGVTMFGWWIL